MSSSFLEFLRQGLHGEQPPHPLDCRVAKHWVKSRLKKIYPELQDDPNALERAYRQLGIEQQEGAGKGGCAVYEITLPTTDGRR